MLVPVESNTNGLGLDLERLSLEVESKESELQK